MLHPFFPLGGFAASAMEGNGKGTKTKSWLQNLKASIFGGGTSEGVLAILQSMNINTDASAIVLGLPRMVLEAIEASKKLIPGGLAFLEDMPRLLKTLSECIASLAQESSTSCDPPGSFTSMSAPFALHCYNIGNIRFHQQNGKLLAAFESGEVMTCDRPFGWSRHFYYGNSWTAESCHGENVPGGPVVFNLWTQGLHPNGTLNPLNDAEPWYLEIGGRRLFGGTEDDILNVASCIIDGTLRNDTPIPSGASQSSASFSDLPTSTKLMITMIPVAASISAIGACTAARHCAGKACKTNTEPQHESSTVGMELL
jgi:hypothetical protein